METGAFNGSFVCILKERFKQGVDSVPVVFLKDPLVVGLRVNVYRANL